MTQKFGYLQDLMVCPVYVASVIPGEVGIQRKVGSEDSPLAPLEVIYSLVTRLLRAQEGRLADVKVPPEEVLGLSSAVPTVGGAEKGQLVRERMRVCFSCGRPGHGVNRCSQVDTSFPFLSQGWSVDVRDAQYREIRTGRTGMWSTPGNEGWSGREGQPPGSSGTKVRLTPAGELVDQREASRHGSCRWSVGLDPVGLRARTLFPPVGSHPTEVRGQDNRQLPVRAKVVLGNRTRLCRTLRSLPSVVPPPTPPCRVKPDRAFGCEGNCGSALC